MEEEIRDRIGIVREYFQKSQEEFGTILGVTKSTISLLETKKRDPSDRLVRDICREFNVNENWLRTGGGEMFIQRTRNQIITDFLGDLIMEDASFKKRLIEALAELDERDWECLEKLATKLTNKKD